MKSFFYQGKSADGRMIKGEIQAASEMEARVKLRAQRVIPLKVVDKASAINKPGSTDLFDLLGFVPKVKSKDLQVFTRQFATLISSGIPIVQSIDVLAQQTTSQALRQCLQKVKSNVESGRRLADAMEGWPGIFNRLYVSMVRAGEEGGALDTILNRLAVYIEKSVKLQNKVISALWYPIAILVFAVVIIVLILTKVIPTFEQLFKGVGSELPMPTQLVIKASHFVRDNFILLGIGTALLVIFSMRYYASTEGRKTVDQFALGIPVFGSIIQKTAIARFSRTVSTMLSCGVGILDSLEIASRTVGNYTVERAIIRARIAITEGRTITQPLLREKVFPPMVTQMIGVGEATGKLDTMLSKVADFYEEEVDTAVTAMTSIIEPVMMVVIGGIIAVLVIAMYLPIFNMAGTFR